MFYQFLGGNEQEPSLYTGALVVFEEEDAVGAYDFLRFIVTYEKEHKKRIRELDLPYVFYIAEDPVFPHELLTHLETICIAQEGILPSDVLIQFNIDQRECFLAYVEHLHDILTKSSHGHGIDEGHSLYPIYEIIIEVQQAFFPPQNQMN